MNGKLLFGARTVSLFCVGTAPNTVGFWAMTVDPKCYYNSNNNNRYIVKLPI